MRRTLTALPILAALFAASVATAATSPLDGHWRINLEETDKVAVKYKDGSGMSGGNFKPNISVMGLPLPRSYRQSPMSNLAAKDPKVLRCTDMQIAVDKKDVVLTYDNADKEKLVKGEHRGRTSKWSKKKIEQRYKTPERSVNKTWTLRDDGRLLVSVKLNPRGDKARTYNRVFDRVEPE
ncbi:MAG: hypothetical protein ACFHXK_01955 [bacterium]